MARTTTPEPTSSGGDTPKQIEDKVRALPANQGLNNWNMWQLIDTEVAQAISTSTYKSNEVYPASSTLNKHGNK